MLARHESQNLLTVGLLYAQITYALVPFMTYHTLAALPCNWSTRNVDARIPQIDEDYEPQSYGRSFGTPSPASSALFTAGFAAPCTDSPVNNDGEV